LFFSILRPLINFQRLATFSFRARNKILSPLQLGEM
jgi:hypothetical protein